MKKRKKMLIVFRHGERYTDTGGISGDGPLTFQGIQTVNLSAEELMNLLLEKRIRRIDLAVVSGSIRCAQTFGLIWAMLHDSRQRDKIAIHECDMRRKFFGTRAENKGCDDLYAKHKSELLKSIKLLGEKEAVMKLAGHLVRPCAARTVKRIRQGFRDGADVILAVTHAPHDTLISEAFSDSPCSVCLKVGKYRILEF